MAVSCGSLGIARRGFLDSLRRAGLQPAAGHRLGQHFCRSRRLVCPARDARLPWWSFEEFQNCSRPACEGQTAIGSQRARPHASRRRSAAGLTRFSSWLLLRRSGFVQPRGERLRNPLSNDLERSNWGHCRGRQSPRGLWTASRREGRQHRRSCPRHRIWPSCDPVGLFPAVREPSQNVEAALGRCFVGRFAAAARVRTSGIRLRPNRRWAGRSWRAPANHCLVGDVGRYLAVHGRTGRGERNSMSAARRVLLIGGIALALWGMGYGLWYAVFAEHQALDGIGSSLAGGFAAAAERNPASAAEALVRYREAKYIYDRQVDVHSHWIGLAMLLIVLGIGFDRVIFSDRLKLMLALGLFLGAVLFPLGVLLQTMSHGSLPRAIAIAGSALVIASLAGIAIGFGRG